MPRDAILSDSRCEFAILESSVGNVLPETPRSLRQYLGFKVGAEGLRGPSNSSSISREVQASRTADDTNSIPVEQKQV